MKPGQETGSDGRDRKHVALHDFTLNVLEEMMWCQKNDMMRIILSRRYKD